MDAMCNGDVIEKKLSYLKKENDLLRRFKSTIDIIPNFMFAVMDKECRFESVSRGYLKLIGKKESEVIGKSAADIVGKARFQILRPNFEKTLSGKPVNYSMWFKFHNQSMKFFNVHYYPVRNNEDDLRVVVVVMDLTQIKLLEEIWTRSEDYRQTIQRLLQIGDWRWEAKVDRIHCSKELFRILGLSRGAFESTYTSYLHRVHPDDREIFKRFNGAKAHEPYQYSKQYRIIRPNGEIRSVLERGEVLVDSSKTPISSYGVIQDITEFIKEEQQSSRIVQTAIDGYCLVDTQGTLLEVNGMLCKILGYSRKELLSLKLSDLDRNWTPEEIGVVLANTVRIGPNRLESKYRCKDKRIIDVEISIHHAEMRHGDFACFIRDITENKWVRMALEKSEHRYRNLFQEAPVMYAIIENRADLPVIVDFNRQFLARLRYKQEEVVGRVLTDFYTEDSKAKAAANEELRCAMNNTLAVSGRDLVTCDGGVVNTLIRAVPKLDREGIVTGSLIMYIDVTQQKQAEEKFKESYELLMTIMDGISDPIIMVNGQMNVIVMNKSARIYFRADGKIPFHPKCHEIFRSNPKPCEGCRVLQAIQTGKKESYERKGIMDAQRIEQVSVDPVLEKGKNASAAIIRIKDITKARLLEKDLIQADKMISLGVLVSGVAHEINNPSNAIMTNTPVLKKAWNCILPLLDKYHDQHGDFSLAGMPYSLMRDEIPGLFAGIESGVARIQRIVNELKTFARPEDTDMDHLVDMNRVVKNGIKLTRNLILEKTGRFKLVCNPNLPKVRGNAQRLEQVVINLIQNACQALPCRERGISISTSFDSQRNSVVVEVADEGVGIPEPILERIMDPFFTTKRNQGGTGLGLSISSTIIKAHEGAMEVNSKPGEGSVFRTRIPVPPFSAKTGQPDQTWG